MFTRSHFWDFSLDFAVPPRPRQALLELLLALLEADRGAEGALPLNRRSSAASKPFRLRFEYVCDTVKYYHSCKN